MKSLSDTIKKIAYLSTPTRKCIRCGEEYNLKHKKIIDGEEMYLRFPPNCPKCQTMLDAEIQKEKKEAAQQKEMGPYKHRVKHIEEYLFDIGVPYPNQTQAHGLKDYITDISNAIMQNNWVIFGGTPGGGKSYMASMVFRRLALLEALYQKTFLYRSMTHLIGEIKNAWDSEGFDTGERLIKECQRADILSLEVNNTSLEKKSTPYFNERLFQIVDDRYIKMHQKKFAPTIFIIVTGKGQNVFNALKNNNFDDAVIDRMLEFGAANTYRFDDSNFRRDRVMEIKKVTRVK